MVAEKQVNLNPEQRLKAAKGEVFEFSRVRLARIPVFDPGEVVRVIGSGMRVRIHSVKHCPGDERGFWIYRAQVHE